MAHGLTSTMPPAPAQSAEDKKISPELRRWLARGWEAKCVRCNYGFTSHVRPGDAHCPRCNSLPTLATQMAAISSMPQPETDRYNAKQARAAEDAVYLKQKGKV